MKVILVSGKGKKDEKKEKKKEEKKPVEKKPKKEEAAPAADDGLSSKFFLSSYSNVGQGYILCKILWVGGGDDRWGKIKSLRETHRRKHCC